MNRFTAFYMIPIVATLGFAAPASAQVGHPGSLPAVGSSSEAGTLTHVQWGGGYGHGGYGRGYGHRGYGYAPRAVYRPRGYGYGHRGYGYGHRGYGYGHRRYGW